MHAAWMYQVIIMIQNSWMVYYIEKEIGLDVEKYHQQAKIICILPVYNQFIVFVLGRFLRVVCLAEGKWKETLMTTTVASK